MPTPVRRRREDRTAPKASRYSSRADEDDEDDDLDEEEESPRARRRKARDEEPAPRRRKARDDDEDEDDDLDDEDEDDDDEDEDEPPRRRRGSRARDDDDEDDDDEDEPPRRRGRVKEESTRRRRSRDDDEDDDEEPRGRRGGARRSASSGWDAFNKKRKQMGNFANELKISDDGEQVLIKILDDEPFASYGQHWVTTTKGLRSYTCLEDGCPLCDKAGDSPRAMAAFNVLQLDETAKPKLMVWAVGPQIAQLLENKANARTGPLSREYYAVSRSKGGKKGPVQYAVDLVKTRDLLEDWGVKPLKDAELDKLAAGAYDEEKFVQRKPRKELVAVARDAIDEDD